MKSNLERVVQLIDLAREVSKTGYSSDVHIGADTVQTETFSELRSSSLSFIRRLYKENHPYYTDFDRKVHLGHAYEIEIAIGILNSVKTEIQNGWIVSLRGLVSAEIFTDFIEMSEYLLVEGYKDPAAVIIGGVLEEHLRQLCIINGIEILNSNEKYKKAELLNTDLSAKLIYNKLDQKSVTSWLDLRNKAAHGRYNEYNKEQVENMMKAVIEFMSRNELK
jgi:hypothetical protein